jgi:hypothetical protein
MTYPMRRAENRGSSHRFRNKKKEKKQRQVRITPILVDMDANDNSENGVL